MGLGLKREFSFTTVDDLGFIVRSSDQCIVAALDPLEALILDRLDADEPLNLIRQVIALDLGREGSILLDRVINRLRPLLDERACSTGNGIYDERLRRHAAGIWRTLPGPKILHWAVTRYCPRRCVYCYAEPLHGSVALDAAISSDRMEELLAEAASLGAKGFLLSGSEPLLRPDVPELIGVARSLGLEVLLTTKMPISESLARRLAESGLECLSLSVDTLDPATSLALIGSSSYPTQIRRTARNLNEAGVPFAIQAVLTPQSLQHIDDLAAFAAEAGAAAIQFVPFEQVRNPISPVDQSKLKVSDSAAKEAVSVIQNAYPTLKVSLFNKNQAETCDELHCDIGGTKLFFTPEGRVHRCYKLTHDESLYGADLREVGIAEAWHDSSFNSRLVPPKEAYANTSCSTCGSFNRCNQSGRCIFEADVIHNRYAAPDRNCSSWKSSPTVP